jgi:hypothetical protein
VKAVILILKHATSLRLLDISPELALTQAELAYQKANIDLKIQQLLAGSFQEHSVQLFAGFIMVTDIGLFILALGTIMSHQAFSAIVVFSQMYVLRKGYWFKQFL